jgi:twitching motility protein PilT
MIDYINQNYAKHIVTIEDPIEYLFNDKKSIIEQREVGLDTLSYHEALKNVLRQTPDVILIGDILSLETMQIALKAAETGHLVLSTLHTTSTVHAIERIVSFFPPHQHDEIRMQVSLLFKGIISQRLINRFEAKGRVPACEILVSTPTVRSLILEGKTNEIYPLIHDGGFYGMQTFNQSLVKFYKDKRVSLEEIKNNTDNPEELELFLKGFYSAKEEGTQRF